MKVLGVSTAHDSSVCLYEDGKILAYYKEERLTKIKKDSNPLRATEEIFKTTDSIDLLAYGDPNTGENIHEYIKFLKKRTSIYDVVDFSSDHHLQHASLAFYNSGFEEAVVIVIDRNGTVMYDSARESETIFHASYPHNFKTIYKNYWVFNSQAHANFAEYRKNNPDIEIDVRSMYGIVKVYETATSLIQQHILENGKTMGLSSYGDKTVKFPELFVNGTNVPNDYYFGHEKNDGDSFESVYLDLTDLKNKSFTKHNVKIYADYAWHVQSQTQDAACHLIKKAIEKTGCKNVIITGGYGLNIVANAHYIKNFPDVKFYFEPLADDSGNSIGSAMLAYRMATKDATIYSIQDTFYHGQLHDTSSVGAPTCNIDDVVKLLMNNKSVAIFKGLAEAGPRSLGNRSILFDARNPEAKDIVNKIKKREWYRPFAVMILKEDATDYFDMLGQFENKFMTVNYMSKDLAKEKIPGVIHIDGSCRIQTIDETDGIVYELLKKFKEKTGVGALLNTSFNLAGEPLVDSPSDALNVLKRTTLNYVWFPESNKLAAK